MTYSIRHTTDTNNVEQTEILCSHSNHRGDIIARSDSTGSLTFYAVYEAYGTRPFEWTKPGTSGNPDRQYANTKDEETALGLLNEGMRYRDLYAGTFLTCDPIGYADGPNIYCYVHCNPVTGFDPLGLKWWNPLAGDFVVYSATAGTYHIAEKVVTTTVDSAVNLTVNTGRHVVETGRQLVRGHPITAARVALGAPVSVLTGDIFDKANGVTENATGVSVNGIFNNKTDADNLRKIAQKGTGQKTQAVKNGTHFFGIGDLIQCAGESIGAITTPSLNYADAMRKINKNHPNGTLEATGHSEGGSVLNNGSKLLKPSINKRTSVQTFGAQVAAPNNGTFKDVYNERASGGWWGGDPVPYLDPRNYGNWLFDNNIINNSNHKGHTFVKNYGLEAIERAEKTEKP